MSEEVPRLNLAPKLNRTPQLWNPLDYLRLLYWVFYFPQALRWYEETFVSPEFRGAMGKGLWRAFTHDIVLRQFVLQAFVLCLFAASALAWALEQFGLQVNWFGVAFGVAVGVPDGVAGGAAGGVALGLAFGMAFGMAFGVAVGVAVGVAFGVTWILGVLRPDAWAVAIFFSFLSRPASMAACTALPLPGLRRRLKY